MTEEEELEALKAEKERRRENAQMLAKKAAEVKGAKAADEINEMDFVDDYTELLEKAEPRAVRALIDIAENGTSESARVAAANALLDRKRGRPTQSIEHKGEAGGGTYIQINAVAEQGIRDLLRGFATRPNVLEHKAPVQD